MKTILLTLLVCIAVCPCVLAQQLSAQQLNPFSWDPIYHRYLYSNEPRYGIVVMQNMAAWAASAQNPTIPDSNFSTFYYVPGPQTSIFGPRTPSRPNTNTPPIPVRPPANPQSVASESVRIAEQLTGSDVKAIEKVALEDGKPWSVAFKVKLDDIAGSMSVTLLKGDERVGWMGADNYYKAESAFLGKDMPSTRPADKEWHAFDYQSDGKTIVLYCDGNKSGEMASSAAPQAIRVTSDGMKMAVGDFVITGDFQKDPLPGGASGNLFVDYFDDPSSFPARWSETDNTARIDFTSTGISLVANDHGLPAISTRTNPFAGSDDWSVNFGYRFSTIGNYGSELRCLSADGGTNVLVIHQDVNGQFIQINGKSVHQTSANTDWHIVTLVKSGHRFIGYRDGVEIGESDVTTLPAMIRIGGIYEDGSWNWSSVDLQFVRVSRGKVVYGKTALNLPQGR